MHIVNNVHIVYLSVDKAFSAL